jgi:hypothetical protein
MAKKKAKAKKGKRKGAAKSRPTGVHLTNFTGVVRQNRDKTIGVFGRGVARRQR